MNFFGVKTTLSKADRNYLSKKTKSQLIDEALLLNLIVDESFTKAQILNQIKNYRKLIDKEQKTYNMQNLLDALPTVDKKIEYDYSKIREKDEMSDYSKLKHYRMPPGSKIVRKEQGLTKTQKTQIRREIKNEIDKLSDLLKTI